MSKTPQGEEEIVIQGDVGDEIVEMIRQQVGALKGVPVDQITRVNIIFYATLDRADVLF